MFSAMPKSAKGWPKEKIFSMVERYSAKISCSGGIEISDCSLATINDYWGELLPMMAAIIKEPSLNDDDIRLATEGEAATTKQYIQDPEEYINDVVNDVFYPEGHPYRQQAEDTLTQLKTISRAKLQGLHQQMMKEAHQEIIVVGSLPLAQLKSDLNKHFGALKLPPKPREVKVTAPTFKKSKAFNFKSKDIPTAYISIKTVLPGTMDDLEPSLRLLFAILSDELFEEVRTKRSLSYSVYAHVIMHQMGVGMIGASTSQPKETLDAIMDVIHKIKTRPYTDQQLVDFKTRFVTKYFLTLEAHDSLSDALIKNVLYRGHADRLYEMPRILERVTPKDIMQLADKYLTGFRIGVIYDKKKFKTTWANDTIARSLNNKK
jgi:predicted Zn-dependent peptidase